MPQKEGLNGPPREYWQITGRTEQYASSDDALAILQQEATEYEEATDRALHDEQSSGKNDQGDYYRNLVEEP